MDSLADRLERQFSALEKRNHNLENVVMTSAIRITDLEAQLAQAAQAERAAVVAYLKGQGEIFAATPGWGAMTQAFINMANAIESRKHLSGDRER